MDDGDWDWDCGEGGKGVARYVRIGLSVVSYWLVGNGGREREKKEKREKEETEKKRVIKKKEQEDRK